MTSSTLPSHLQPLLHLLPPTRILPRASTSPTRFHASSSTWSIAHDHRPEVVVEPATEAELSTLVRFLVGDTGGGKLDFAVRGSGCGNSSARDVVISMAGFKGMEFDRETETCVIEAGNDWGEVDRWLEEVVGGEYVVVGSRCPFVGVTGSTLMGGLSWLSSSLGLGSDPANLLDVRIVLPSGRCVWASTEPKSPPLHPDSPDSDLLWALRGGGGNFGIVTALKLQAHRLHDDPPFPSTTTNPSVPPSMPLLRRKPWSGMIRFSSSIAALDAVSRGVSAFASRSDATSVGLALHVFIVDFSQSALHGGAATPDLVLLPFDPYGEAHARSAEGFAWALDLPGADASLCKEMTLAQVHALQGKEVASHGKLESWMQAALVGGGFRTVVGEGGRQVRVSEGGREGDGVVDEEMVSRCWDWYVSMLADPETRRLGVGAFALLEIMQAPAMMGSEWYKPRVVTQQDDGVGITTANGASTSTSTSTIAEQADTTTTTSNGDGTTTSVAGMTTSIVGSNTAWPHATLGRKNILQLGVGCERAEREDQRAADARTAHRILREFPTLIAGPGRPPAQAKDPEGKESGDGKGGKHPGGHFLPNFTHAPQVHDLSMIFGGNWERLRAVKRRYDPGNRFDKGFGIPPADG